MKLGLRNRGATARGRRNLATGCVSNECVKRRPPATVSVSVTTIAVCLLAAITLGQGFVPRKIKDVRPVYPRESLQGGDEGWVILELSVTSSGTVGKVVTLGSQCKRLEQAALTAVRQWQYEPVRLNGEPVPFTVVSTFRSDCHHDSRAGRIGACKWTDPPMRISD